MPHFLDEIAATVGLEGDLFLTVVLVLLSYPLGFAMRLIKNVTFRHIYSLVLGVLYIFLCFNWQIFHFIIPGLICYLLLYFNVKYSRRIVFYFMLCYLFGLHVYGMITRYLEYTLDITGPMMLLTTRLSSLGYNIHDGSGRNKRVTKDQKERSIPHLPSLLHYWSFIFYFGGILMGPPYEIREFLDFMSHKLNLDKPKDAKPDKLTDGLFEGLKKLLTSFFFGGLMFFLSIYFNDDFLKTGGYLKSNWIRRFLFSIGLGIAVRSRYYTGMIMSEGANIFSGFGFNGYDKNGNKKWDRLVVFHPIKVETAQSWRDVSESWNIRVNAWLKRYAYLRFAPIGTNKSTTVASYLTYLISAFWHGLYPGYYMAFLTMSLVLEAGKAMRRNVRPFFLKDNGDGNYPFKYIYDGIGTIIIGFGAANYCGLPFHFLEFKTALMYWKGLYFYLHILCIVVLVVFTVGGKFMLRFKKVKLENERRKALHEKISREQTKDKQD
ncbi:oysgedart isoform a [Anaeramoeba ignava]|uniref:Oysgedart isoform a n=1 Tax=Anaeramoeba ignava TaxID=1746090 RepID=A0A9Q0REF2_ANAIG|nr:oysgedart isoform a [Anaeramoeba ignava]|eukprot:Anaeramoba_ignava/a750_93.p1 GENE.a750_93~~a750_93.p1  ORF type:complete len:492 (-),score=103.35 a750_93:30-1505(-)